MPGTESDPAIEADPDRLIDLAQRLGDLRDLDIESAPAELMFLREYVDAEKTPEYSNWRSISPWISARFARPASRRRSRRSRIGSTRWPIGTATCLAREGDADQTTILRASRTEVIHGSGMVLVSPVQDETARISLFFDEGTALTIEKSSGVVEFDGRTVARIIETGTTVCVEGQQALPELQWLAVLAVYADSRNAEAMRGISGTIMR